MNDELFILLLEIFPCGFKKMFKNSHFSQSIRSISRVFCNPLKPINYFRGRPQKVVPPKQGSMVFYWKITLLKTVNKMGELCESEQGEGERDDFQVIKKNIALKLSVKNIDK